MRLIFLLIAPLLLLASEIKTTIVDIKGKKAIVNVGEIQRGVSGIVVRKFNDNHSAIIAEAVVIDYNKKKKMALLGMSKYRGLTQNALPTGNWIPRKGDTVILAHGYGSALLIAPSEDIYNEVKSRIDGIYFSKPSGFATYLSYKGHPTPLEEDIRNYCAISTVGLLYMYVKDTLFSADCLSMQLLQATYFPLKRKTTQLPFFSRVNKINANWFGSGSSKLKKYDPYYLRMIVENNKYSKVLIDYRSEMKKRANEKKSK
ncbi:MAG: plasminogen-binding N-terminal domain-containing protein [Campylobacterota bacterium]|nr:plasminogen-binding N-terminal domain-containing protein [Campylobacterota bacterium]